MSGEFLNFHQSSPDSQKISSLITMKNQLILLPLLVCVALTCSSPRPEPTVSSSVAVKDPVIENGGPMADAAVAFLKSLSPDLREAATFPFNHPGREKWNFVPLDNRVGARIGHMTPEQQSQAFFLLRSGLSMKGYEIARAIMDLEKILIIKEKQAQGSDYRNPTKYFISIYGDPVANGAWGWKYEGHHLSLNYSAVSGKLSVTPSFLGSNPAEVDIQHVDQGKRVLGEREDEGRRLMLSLTEEQQQKALISKKAYPEIVTGTESHARLEKFEGLPYSEMTPGQQEKLVALIKLHMNVMRPEVVQENWARIEDKGLKNLYFSWAGGLERNEQHYYRIHGPVTIIEYDNAQNNGNHAHIVWRDPESDFGRDLLREHHLKHDH